MKHPTPDDARGSAVILVVDDEEAVRAPISRMLRHLGYFVLEATNGEHALHVMQEYHSPVHLVISDVRMPEMEGTELVSLLRGWYPQIRVLLISGVAGHGGAEAAMIPGGAFLAKPFSLDELSTTVRSLLNTEWAEES